MKWCHWYTSIKNGSWGAKSGKRRRWEAHSSNGLKNCECETGEKESWVDFLYYINSLFSSHPSFLTCLIFHATNYPLSSSHTKNHKWKTPLSIFTGDQNVSVLLFHALSFFLSFYVPGILVKEEIKRNKVEIKRSGSSLCSPSVRHLTGKVMISAVWTLIVPSKSLKGIYICICIYTYTHYQGCGEEMAHNWARK